MKVFAAAIAIPVLVLTMVVVSLTMLSGPTDSQGNECPQLSSFDTSSASPSAQNQASAQQQASGEASQQQVLSQIIGQVKAYGLPQQAATDAVTAGLAESGLRDLTTAVNLDSIGVFQERPSQGWGTAQQIASVPYATDKWLQHLLGSVPNWQGMAPGDVAQAVERSADPQRYAQFVQQAQTWVGQAWNATAAATPVLAPSGSSASSPPAPGTSTAASSSSENTTACPTLQGAEQAAAVSTMNSTEEGGLWPVQLPVPAPGWQQQISLPKWPASEAASPPTAISNQCVAGAEWAYDALHQSTYKFPSANGVDVARTAAGHGLVASAAPQVGDIVSFSIAGSSAGHVALVIATSQNAFEVVEQNWVQDNGYTNSWSPTDWDVRSVAWPNSSVVGFAGPAVGST